MNDSLRLYRTFELSMKSCIESILNRGKNKSTLKNRADLKVITTTTKRYIIRSIPPKMHTIRSKSKYNIESIRCLCDIGRPSLIYRSHNDDITLSTYSKRRR
jgi:hypothetical protein